MPVAFIKSRWLLWSVLAVFVFCKIPHLHYPFYVDEGQVYAPALKMMASHGPSLFPGSLPDEFSRGHPLMFHFLGALWIKCFGTSNIALHSFPLLLSVFVLFALYECCLRLFGKNEAVLALLVVATQVVFFVQASFVYPEIMLALFTLLGLYFYSRDQLLLTSFSLFMLFFTKEGGMIYGAVIGIHAFISLFKAKESIRVRLLRLAAVSLPVCLIGLFFVLQNAKLGWYVLPEHTHLIKEDWSAYFRMFRRGVHWAFRGDKATYVLELFTIALSIMAALKQKNFRYLFLVPLAVIVWYLAEIFAQDTPGSAVWMLVFLMASAIPVWQTLHLNKALGAPARRFILLSGFCVILFLLYSSLTEIGYRYLLANILLVLIFLSVSIGTYITATGKHLFYIALVGVLLIGIYGFRSNTRFEDTQLGAFHVMNVELANIAYLQRENAYNKEVAVDCAIEGLWFTDTIQGFVTPGRVFTNITRFPIKPSTEYVVLGNTCQSGDAAYRQMLADTAFQSVYKIKDHEIWAEIFKRK